ncbi:MAG TPA: phasin family protein [Sphingomicrobium sp.]|nr:phasin family protein [Sphingomicrobium sp.]
MTDQTKVQAEAAAEAPAKVANAVAETATKVVQEAAAVAKRERASTKRRTARKAKVAAVQQTARRKAPRRAKRAAVAAKAAAPRIERTKTMKFDTNFFGAIPAAAPFQTLFADAGERGQEAFKRTQKAAEDLAELTRANLEAFVDAGRIAVEGTRALGQDVVASSRQGVEQAADAVRSFAEAKSPTEFLQLQGEFARSSFDRLVAESSKLTESMVKLAGEAIQPISNRASVSAERLNKIVA